MSAMKQLTEAQWKFWKENGYVIVSDSVPRENLQATVDAVYEFMEMDPDDPESWYRRPDLENGLPELNKSGMIELYHHQALWNNRQHPRVYGAFADIWETEKLWVKIDRANLNPPRRQDWDFRGFIHWDIDTSLKPVPFEVQGLIALTDTSQEQGGFQCVPGFHRRFPEWVRTQPSDRDPFRPDTSGMEIQKIEMKAGDLLIWNSLLPHGTSANLSNRPRLAQYITMFPAQPEDSELRRWRIRAWQECLKPEGPAFPGDPRDLERKNCRPAELTELGRKLLGLDPWK